MTCCQMIFFRFKLFSFPKKYWEDFFLQHLLDAYMMLYDDLVKFGI